jgi:PRTRC genetic system protein B
MKTLIVDDAPLRKKLGTAILFYHGTENTTGTAVARTVARYHEVLDVNGRMTLGPGDFVTRSAIEALVESLDQRSMTFLPAHVLAAANHAVAWWEPASTRVMYFKTKDAVNALDGRAIPQPPLVFIARNSNLYVYALLEDERPTITSQLAYAPYWNLFAGRGDTVCVGSTPFPKTHDPERTAEWTAAFFNSNFTHAELRSHEYPGSYAEMIGAAIAEGTFRREWLRPMNKTLGDALCGK